jgi:excinuclease ABC subunit B
VGVFVNYIPLPELKNIILELEKQFLASAENLEFETAAGGRDQIFELREILALESDLKA